MGDVTRRCALQAATVVTVAAGFGVVRGNAKGDNAKAVKLWTLEGQLNIHPKYIYRYYLVFGDGQKCALYGGDHAREPEMLSRLRPSDRIRVRGVLGTAHHRGGTKDNPSPFGETWELYMDVREVERLK